jgi:hypothetical protein
MPLPKGYILKIVGWGSLVRVHLTTAHRDCANNPLEMWSQRWGRFGNRFANVDFPEMIEFDGNIDPNSRQSYQIIRGYDPEPASRNDQPAAAIDVEAVAGLQALPPAGPLQIGVLQSRRIR